jgi:hypothetical protein
MAKRVAARRAHGERSHQVDKDENIIPIDHQTSEIIAQQKKLFREKFGREPGPEDPLFFDPGVATPQFLSVESQEEVWKSLLQAAGDSEIDPAIVYCDEQNRAHRDRNQRTVSDRRRTPRMA